MAERFEIQMESAKRVAERCEKTYQDIEKYSASIQNISNSLPGNSYAQIRVILQNLAEENNLHANQVKALEYAVNTCLELYAAAEKRIVEGETAKAISSEKTEGNGTTSPTEEENILDSLIDILMQVLGISDEGSFFAVLIRVLLDFVPILGKALDFWDLGVNIGRLIDDGPQASEWVSLIFSVIGFVPIFGELVKYGDEGIEAAGGIVKHSDDLWSPVKKYADKCNDFMEKNILNKLDEIISGNPTVDKIRHAVENLWNCDTGFFEMTPGEYLKELLQEMKENNIVDWIQKNVDGQSQLNHEEIGDATIIREFAWAA